jgi:hypothetical protein
MHHIPFVHQIAWLPAQQASQPAHTHWITKPTVSRSPYIAIHAPMYQCTVHAPTPVHAPNCLPCVHQTAFHAVLEPVRPCASVLGVRSDANTYVLLHLRPRVVPAQKKARCAHVYLMSVCVLLCVRSAFACAGAHATRACVQSPQRVHLHQHARAVSARPPCPGAGTSKARVRAALRACWCAYHSVGCASARCALHTFKALP